MSILIDTNIAIHLRDGDANIVTRLQSFGALPQLSIVTRVELEGGVAGTPAVATRRRARLDEMFATMKVHDFDGDCALSYRTIVERCGFSRTRVLDRMIAATAIVHDLTLVTINGADFADIPDLKLDIWPSPAAQ